MASFYNRFGLMPAMYSGKIYMLPYFLLWSTVLQNFPRAAEPQDSSAN